MAHSEGYVPVYLADRTVIGKAKISEDGLHAEITINTKDAPILEWMSENLVGLAIVMQAGTPAEAIKKEENTTDA